MGCHALLQRIFLTQGSNPCLLHFLHWQVGSLPLAREPQSHLNQICKGGWGTDFSFPRTEKLYFEKTCQNNDFETFLTSAHTGNTCFFATTYTHTHTHTHTGFPSGSVVKKPPAMQETRVQIPGWGRSPGEGNGNPLQYSCLENPMHRGAWRVTVHGITKG